MYNYIRYSLIYTSLDTLTTTLRLDKFLKMLAAWLPCALQIDDVKIHDKCMHACTHSTLACCHVHRGLHEQHERIFFSHELHSYILVCISMCLFLVFLACTHAGLARVIQISAWVLTPDTTESLTYLLAIG